MNLGLEEAKMAQLLSTLHNGDTSVKYEMATIYLVLYTLYWSIEKTYVRARRPTDRHSWRKERLTHNGTLSQRAKLLINESCNKKTREIFKEMLSPYLYAKNSGESKKNPDDSDVARNWTAFVDKLSSFQTEQKSFNEDVLTLVKSLFTVHKLHV